MIVEYIRYKIPEDTRDAFEGAYDRARTALAASSHCLAYELSRCVEEPASYILRIEWDSVEGHMRGFRTSPEFRAFFAEVRPFVGQIEEMRHYEPTAVRGACKAGESTGDAITS
ncbi:MAG TPA: antibiotic biosynthesis monooxygenase family protein [Longimicrobium sp.]|jgi:quinol monooxygenase YgiN